MRLCKYGTTALIILVGLLLCDCARNERGAMPTAPGNEVDGPVAFAKCEGEDCSLHGNCIGIKPATIPLNGNKKFSVVVRLNCKTPAAALTIPLSYAGYPDISIDTSIVDAYGNKGITQENLGARGVWAYRTSLVDNDNKNILIGYVSCSGCLPASKGPLVRVHFKLSATASPGVAYVDSTHIPPAHTLVLSDRDANEKKLYLHRGKITIGSPSPDIGLSTSRLVFKRSTRTYNIPYQTTAVVSGGTPGQAGGSLTRTVQTFDISNVGVGRLKWTVADNRPWISVSPRSGTGEGTVAVSVHTMGLLAGSYTGTVTVIDPSAVNSPRTVMVTLIVTGPPDWTLQSDIGMSAEADGPLPPPSWVHPWDY